MRSDHALTEEIFQEAVEIEKEAREEFLAGFPPDHADIINDVRSLLQAFDSSPKILESSATEVYADMVREPEANLVGQEFGNYRIQKLLGRGGMGDVYLADDVKLDRRVALKFLSSNFVDDAWARRQLIREAKAVATFDHPNICRVYGIEETGEYRFMVMEFLDGVSLAELISAKAVEAETVPQIVREIAEAIAEAHRHGVIHRDIKPANIIIGRDGHIKVLDFGLAKFLPTPDGLTGRGSQQSRATQPGLIFGTIAYMSPEQLKGEKLDQKSDVFSIGTVIAELIRGIHPFERASQAETISAILAGGLPPAKKAFTKEMNPALERVAARCLERKKEARYQSAVELAIQLGNRRKEWRFAWERVYTRGALALLLIGLVILGGYFVVSPTRRARSITVLPYRNETGDSNLNYLSDGLALGLGTKLASYDKIQAKFVTALAIPAGADVDPMIFGRNNSLDYVLTGSLTKQNDQFALRLNALDVNQGVTVRTWTHSFNLDALPSLENETADELLAQLNLSEDQTKKLPLHRGGETDNSAAFREYWLGRYYWKQRDEENLKRAIDSFQRSIQLDPAFSRPYAGLADSYVLLNLVAYGNTPTKEAMTKARATALQAIEIDPMDAEAHTSLGVVFSKYDWNWEAAENEFTLAIKDDPNYSPAHYWYSSLLAILGREDEAIREAQSAKDLDPLFPQVNINLARVFYYGRRYDDALQVLNTESANGVMDKKSQYLIGLIYLQKGLYEQAKTIFEMIAGENQVLAASGLGFAYAKLGRREDALRLIAELKDTAKTRYIPPQEFAIIYAGLGDNKEALFYLGESYSERHSALISAKVEPLFDGLRKEKEFIALLDSMKLA